MVNEGFHMFPRWKIKNILLASSNFMKNISVKNNVSGCVKNSLVFSFPSQINLGKNQINMFTSQKESRVALGLQI